MGKTRCGCFAWIAFGTRVSKRTNLRCAQSTSFWACVQTRDDPALDRGGKPRVEHRARTKAAVCRAHDSCTVDQKTSDAKKMNIVYHFRVRGTGAEAVHIAGI